MIRTMWNGKARALVIAISLAGAAVLLATAAPLPVSNGPLGSDWHCSKAAFVLTTCRQTSDDNVSRKTGDAKNPPA
jgi:hypothetical protein